MSPPPYHWRDIHPNAILSYIRDVHLTDTIVDALTGPVGFDLEWKPTFTKNTPENPVAIVQLANESHILVIQVSAMTEFPTKLRDFLENPAVTKAGVGIQNDAKKLYRDCGVSISNCVDLSLLARCADNAQWKGKYSAPLGLARLVEAYESLALPKGKISRSNWEGRLTSKEVDYAGNDAHAGFVVYQRLWAMANTMAKIPKPVYYSFCLVRGNLCEPSGMHWNCHNPEYDPGPPPPPKPPTARNIRRATANADATNSGNTMRLDFVPSAYLIPTPSTNPRSPQFGHVQRVIHRRINSYSNPDPGASDPVLTPPDTLQLPEDGVKPAASNSSPHRRRRRRREMP